MYFKPLWLLFARWQCRYHSYLNLNYLLCVIRELFATKVYKFFVERFHCIFLKLFSYLNLLNFCTYAKFENRNSAISAILFLVHIFFFDQNIFLKLRARAFRFVLHIKVSCVKLTV